MFAYHISMNWENHKYVQKIENSKMNLLQLKTPIFLYTILLWINLFISLSDKILSKFEMISSQNKVKIK